VRRTNQRRRATALVTVLATAAGLLAFVLAAPPASAGTNPNTTYEFDCTTSLGASTAVSPFLVTANLNASPDPSFPTGATFGATGALSVTVQGPQLSAFAGNGLLIGGQIAMSVNGLQISSTDGTATGSYAYNHNFPAQAPNTRNAGAVSWSAGATTLTGGFIASDIGGGLTGTGFQNGTTIINVSGGVATLSMATTAASSSAGLLVYLATTYTDASVNTGSVFTTAGTAGSQARIGVTQLTGGIAFDGSFIDPSFGSAGAGAGIDHCMLTGWQGATPGPGQTGNNPTGPWPPYAGAPLFPSVVTTPLVAATGGFISQPGTTQQITPAAAAFVALADTPPNAQNLTVALGTGQSKVITLPSTSSDPTPATSCALVGGSISDARLTVTNLNNPSVCSATITDTGSGVGTVTFQFTASDAAGTGPAATVTVNIGTPTVDESLSQLVNGGQLVLSCDSPDTNGGTPDLTCDDFAFGNVTLNGLAQTRTGAGSTLYVSDNRGDPALGWSLTAYMVATSDNPNASCAGVVAFCNADIGTNALNPNGQIDKSNLSIGSIVCAPHAGNLNAAGTVGAGGTFASTQTLCSAAAGSSGGTFDVTKSFTLNVPSSVFAGTYWATVQYLVQ
jgi:hypothetical protein